MVSSLVSLFLHAFRVSFRIPTAEDICRWWSNMYPECKLTTAPFRQESINLLALVSTSFYCQQQKLLQGTLSAFHPYICHVIVLKSSDLQIHNCSVQSVVNLYRFYIIFTLQVYFWNLCLQQELISQMMWFCSLQSQTLSSELPGFECHSPAYWLCHFGQVT